MLKPSYLSLYFYLVLTGFLFCQKLPQESVIFSVTDQENNPVNDITISITPIGNTTGYSLKVDHTGDGQFKAKIPSNLISCSEFLVNLSGENYEDYSTIYSRSQRKQLSIKVLYNNYYKKYKVNPGELIEIFDIQNYNFQQANNHERTLKIFIPYLPEHFNIHNYKRESAFYQYISRERGYHEVLREIILQTTAYSSNFAIKDIREWISGNYTNFGNKDLSQLSDFIIKSPDIFSSIFIDKTNSLSTHLQGINFTLSIKKASDEGLLEAIILFLAYQSFQKECYEIINNHSRNSELRKDEAFSNALSRLNQTIQQEHKKQLEEFIVELQTKKIYSVIKEFIGQKILSASLGKVLGLSKLSNYLISGFVWDVFSSAKTTVNMDLTMLLTAQIDKYLFTEFSSAFNPSLTQNFKNNPDYSLGTMMRIHAGFLYNTTRNNFYSGKKMGFTGAAFHILSQVISDKAPYIRKIAQKSHDKVEQARKDYWLVSDLIGLSVKNNPVTFFESNIVNYFSSIIDSNHPYNSLRDALIIDYVDLNNDEIPEAIVRELYSAGAQNANYYIFQSTPFKAILKEIWCCDIKINNHSHKGYVDIVAPIYISGEAVDPSLSVEPYYFIWNGQEYQERL